MQKMRLTALERSQIENVQRLNRGRDVPRRAGVAGHYASPLIRLEVWAQEILHELHRQQVSAEQQKERELQIYAAIAMQLGEMFPELQLIINRYVETLGLFHKKDTGAGMQTLSQNLIDLNCQIGDQMEQIQRLEAEFEQKNLALERAIRDAQVRRTELENLRLLLEK